MRHLFAPWDPIKAFSSLCLTCSPENQLEKTLVNCKQCSKMSFTHSKSTNCSNQNFGNYEKRWRSSVRWENAIEYSVWITYYIQSIRLKIQHLFYQLGSIFVKELISVFYKYQMEWLQWPGFHKAKGTYFQWICKKYKIDSISHQSFVWIMLWPLKGNWNQSINQRLSYKKVEICVAPYMQNTQFYCMIFPTSNILITFWDRICIWLFFFQRICFLFRVGIFQYLSAHLMNFSFHR